MARQSKGRALVVGLGIAGMTAAVRLRQIGWQPVLIEKAAERRSGGYFIMLFGAGIASAQRLGVLEEIGDRLGEDVRAFEVDRAARRTPGMSPTGLNTPDGSRPRLILRGDAERALFGALGQDVEIRYSTTLAHIAQDADGAAVTLRNTATGAESVERFDLVVGADGMRSTVRRLAFGDQDYLHPMNYMTGATLLDEPPTGFTQQEGLVLAEPGRSVWTFPFADRAPSLLFSYRTDDIDAEFARAPIDSIRAAFGPQPPSPLLEDLFQRFEKAPDFLFDSVHQVKMPSWRAGRVVLLGDAAWCMTLYSGMGASSALAGGDLLGTMIQRHDGDLPAALAAWEQRMRPFITTQQEGAHKSRLLFTPHDRTQHILRTGLLRALNTPGIKTVLGRLMARNPEFVGKNTDIAAA